MTGSVHAAIGAAIGSRVKNKPLALVLGIVSHGVGDVVPHLDMGPAETPIVFATLAKIGMTHGFGSSQFLGALGGVLPDFEHIPAELKKDPRRFEPMPEKLFPTHNGKLNHARWPLEKRWGVWMQVLLFIGGLALAGTIARRK